MKFYAFLTVTCVVISPGICLMWIILIGVVNWHDALDVTTLVAVVWMIRGMRREDRAAERAIRKITARRWTRHESAADLSYPREWYTKFRDSVPDLDEEVADYNRNLSDVES